MELWQNLWIKITGLIVTTINNTCVKDSCTKPALNFTKQHHLLVVIFQFYNYYNWVRLL